MVLALKSLFHRKWFVGDENWRTYEGKLWRKGLTRDPSVTNINEGEETLVMVKLNGSGRMSGLKRII